MRIPLFILFLAVNLSGCSQFKIFYQNAGTIIEWNISSYFIQDTKDQEVLRRNIDKFLAWHQSKMLPLYAGFLEKHVFIFEMKLNDRNQVFNMIVQFRDLLDQTIRGSSRFVATVLKRHTSRQKLNHFSLQLEQNVSESRLKIAESKISATERFERIKKNFERFTGQLNQFQEGLIESYIRRTSDSFGHWLDRKEKRQLQLISFLENDPEVTDIEKFINNLVLKNENEHSEVWWDETGDLLLNTIESLNIKQRESVINKLKEYASDMRELSRQ